MESFDQYLSLGSNCYIKKYLQLIKKTGETQYFDYTGTSVWSIIDLFNKNFKDMYNPKLIEKIKIVTNKESMVTNTKYYVRLLHDFDHKKDTLTENDIKAFVDKYQRRQKRLYEILMSKSKILFMRLEQDNKNRIFYDRYINKNVNVNDELTDLKTLSDLFKNKFPKLQFAILHINYNNNRVFDLDHNIVSVPSNTTSLNWTWTTTDIVLEQIINNNKAYIDDCLNKILKK